MNKKQKIKWGIIGLGNIAGQFAADLQLINEAELVAVASRDIGKAGEFAKKYDLNFVAQSTFYNYTVDIIKQRLHREGITDINNVNK